MANGILTLYNQVNKNLIEQMELSVQNTYFSYTNSDNSTIQLTLQEDDTDVFYIGHSKEPWEPHTHNLKITRVLTINNKNVLFGETGITAKSNTLGVALKIFSKTSNITMFSPTNQTLTFTESGECDLTLSVNFEASKLRGQINFEVIIYNKTLNEDSYNHSNSLGTNLGSIDSFQVIVDGDGAAFPIVEVEREGQPVWRIEKDWNDVNHDIFNEENVRIELNKKHSMYEQLNKDTKLSRYLMFEILSNAMSTIIYSVIHDDIYDPENFEENSITEITLHWIREYDIDTSNNDTINYSLREKLEKILVG